VSERPYLDALALRCGVERSYVGYDGSELLTADATREALLSAFGFDASSEERAAAALRALDAEAAQPGLQPVRVARADSHDLATVELRLPALARGKLHYRLELELEGGARHAFETETAVAGETLVVPMPARTELSFGYHTLASTLELDGQSFSSTQDLIVAPTSCLQVFEQIGDRRATGLWAHIYSLRSRRSAGIGDLRDLRTLCAWAADLGLELCGINPLHAADNLAHEVSPYYSLSRLYRNPIYLDVEAVVARAGSAEARALLGSSELQGLRLGLQASTRVDYANVYRYKRRVLEAAHRTFAAQHRGRGSELGRAYAAFRSREGQRLRDFATFCALREQLVTLDARHADFRTWPEPYRDPRSPTVADFVAANAEAIDLHGYLQFELEEQLDACQRTARAAGMTIGLYGDLALGDAPFSGDVWAEQKLYASGVNVGAPPDPYADDGQDWGLVPFNPLALRAKRYHAFRALLERAFRSMGALRIDHVMGLTRQFWVPQGSRAAQGGYVRFPLSDLLQIVALESRRARALVIGEDLGVVPEGFREHMAEGGLLRSQVLYFEREPPRSYARAALATLSTHDLPPLAGFWTGRDLVLRRRGGNIASDEALAHAQREREHVKQHLLWLLRQEGLLPADATEPPIEVLAEAMQLLLASAASRIVALALDDLTLEEEPLNVPATCVPDQTNWSRRSSSSLEEVTENERIRALVRAVTQRARES
jgi:4-alpha-glucanotransferase